MAVSLAVSRMSEAGADRVSLASQLLQSDPDMGDDDEDIV